MTQQGFLAAPTGSSRELQQGLCDVCRYIAKLHLVAEDQRDASFSTAGHRRFYTAFHLRVIRLAGGAADVGFAIGFDQAGGAAPALSLRRENDDAFLRRKNREGS